MPNFTTLDMSLPEVAILVAAMVQARDAVGRRSWSHPQEPTGEEWWADVLADPRARKREQRTDLAVKQAFYRLADEKREIILVACSKCDWRAAFSRDELMASHGADYAMPNLLNHLAAPSSAGSAPIGIGAGCITSSRSRARRRHAAEIDERNIEDPFLRMKEAPQLGGYQHITAEECAEYDRIMAAWQAARRPRDDRVSGLSGWSHKTHPRDQNRGRGVAVT